MIEAATTPYLSTWNESAELVSASGAVADAFGAAVGAHGEVIVVAASDKYQLLGRNALGEVSHSTPAISKGVIYLRSLSRLVAVGERVPD